MDPPMIRCTHAHRDLHGYDETRRTCRGARLAEQDFGRLVGRLGSSLYLERFLSHVYPLGRIGRLRSWALSRLNDNLSRAFLENSDMPLAIQTLYSRGLPLKALGGIYVPGRATWHTDCDISTPALDSRTVAQEHGRGHVGCGVDSFGRQVSAGLTDPSLGSCGSCGRGIHR